MLIDIFTLSFHFQLDAIADETIFHLKRLIYEKIGLPCEWQLIYFGGIELEDALSLREYNIDEKCILHLLISYLKETKSELSAEMKLFGESKKGTLQSFRTVASENNVKLDIHDSSSYSLLLRSCENLNKDYRIIKYLVDFSINVNEISHFYQRSFTPLYYSYKNNNSLLFRCLLLLKANVDSVCTKQEKIFTVRDKIIKKNKQKLLRLVLHSQQDDFLTRDNFLLTKKSFQTNTLIFLLSLKCGLQRKMKVPKPLLFKIVQSSF